METQESYLARKGLIDEQVHDLIYIKRTGFWVCKCGESGRTGKSMTEHQIQIESERKVEYA